MPDDEGNKRLAGALIEANKHVGLPLPSARTQAIIGLMLAVASVYKPVVLSAFAGPPAIEAPAVPIAGVMGPAPTGLPSNAQPNPQDWGFPAGNA